MHHILQEKKFKKNKATVEMKKSDVENKQFLKEMLVTFHYAYHSTLPSFYLWFPFNRKMGLLQLPESSNKSSTSFRIQWFCDSWGNFKVRSWQ